MKKLALLASLLFPLGTAACDSTDFKIPSDKDLKPGGVYVSYNLGCQKGCDQIQKGDLIQTIDGKAVATGRDFDESNITDGQPHKLELLAYDTQTTKSVEIVATPKDNLPPLKDVPPFWTVGAAELNQAPSWARRRMFGHASPMVMLVSSDGGILDGRQLKGKKRFIVYWDWSTQQEQATAVSFLQVLQKAQADLKNKGIELMYVQVKFPAGRKEPMNDSDLRDFQKQWTVKGPDGSPMPPVPMYRFPNATEFNTARQIGMENAFTVFENLGASPTIVLLDERGMVRWHSEGVQQNLPEPKSPQPDQATIIEAVYYALEKL